MEDVGYKYILAVYICSIFQDFENYFRREVDLVEDDFKMALDKNKSSFITYELEPGIYTFKDFSEFHFNILQTEYPGPSNVIDIEFDDITLKTNLVVRDGIIATKFDENSFLNTILGFTSGWDYKHYNEYTSQKVVNLKTTIKTHLKADLIDGSVLNGVRQPNLIFSF